MPHAGDPPGGLADNGKGLRQEIVKSLGLGLAQLFFDLLAVFLEVALLVRVGFLFELGLGVGQLLAQSLGGAYDGRPEFIGLGPELIKAQGGQFGFKRVDRLNHRPHFFELSVVAAANDLLEQGFPRHRHPLGAVTLGDSIAWTAAKQEPPIKTPPPSVGKGGQEHRGRKRRCGKRLLVAKIGR